MLADSSRNAYTFMALVTVWLYASELKADNICALPQSYLVRRRLVFHLPLPVYAHICGVWNGEREQMR